MIAISGDRFSEKFMRNEKMLGVHLFQFHLVVF